MIISEISFYIIKSLVIQFNKLIIFDMGSIFPN